MSFQLKEGQAVLFDNEPEGKKPHRKGSVLIEGQLYDLAFWPAKSGKPGCYSGKASKPQDRKPKPAEEGLDDAIPF